MSRVIAVTGLLVGWVLLAAAPLSAQQIRNMPPKPAAPQGPLNNSSVMQQNPMQKIIGFNVAGPTSVGSVGQNGASGGTANAIINGINNGTIPVPGGQNINPYANGGQNINPYANGLGPVFNPYANNAPLNPANYNTMMYGNPYGMPNGYGFNPYYSYYNPYAFMATGAPVGMSGGISGGVATPSPAQLYNFNLNYQYLSNSNLNPLSNPAFSGPFQPGVFNSTAALNILGFSNIMQNFPLNPNGFGGSNFGPNFSNNSTFP